MLSEDAIDQDSENRAPEVVFANSQPGVGVVPTVKQQPSKKPEQASLPNQPLPTARSKFVKIAPKPTDDVAVVVTSSAPSNVVASVCVPAAPAKAATKAARASASTKPALPKSQPSGDASLGKNKRQSLLLNWLKPAAASSMQSAVNGTPSVIALVCLHSGYAHESPLNYH